MAHSLTDFARDLARFEGLFMVEQREALEKACQIVEDEAKRVIGSYDYGWQQLAPSTQAERVRLGYPANEPLLRSGDLRDSISHYLEGADLVPHEISGYVGSPSKIALYQELGTSRIPPRSYLGGAARAKEMEVHELGAEAAHTALAKALSIA